MLLIYEVATQKKILFFFFLICWSDDTENNDAENKVQSKPVEISDANVEEAGLELRRASSAGVRNGFQGRRASRAGSRNDFPSICNNVFELLNDVFEFSD